MTKDRINYLVSEIVGASQAYYEGEPIISDEEFDSLVEELTKLDPDNSVLSKVGWGYESDQITSYTDVKHLVPMKGLPKVKANRDNPLSSYAGGNSEIFTYKLDGLAAEVIYDDGLLSKIITRGDGIVGKDVTERFRKSVPSRITESTKMSIVGEIIINEREVKVREIDLGLTHPRNIAAGLASKVTLSADDELLLECVDIVAHRISYIESHDMHKVVSSYTFDQVQLYLKYNGFKVIDFSFINDKLPLSELISLTITTPAGIYKCDGVVVCDETVTVSIDGTFNYVGSRAIKVVNEVVNTTVKDIVWNLSPTGRLVPLVYVEPVRVSGAEIRKVTGNNYTYLTHQGIGIGSEVSIIRSGEVIPYITKVLTKSNVINKPDVCPECGFELAHVGADIKCINSNCSGMYMNKLRKWISIMASDVDGVGGSMMNDFIEKYGIKKIEDMYQVNTYESTNYTQHKMHELVQAMKAPRDIKKFLVALSIPNLSWSGAEKLVEDPKFMDYLTGKTDKLSRPRGVDNKSIQYMIDNQLIIQRLYIITGPYTVATKPSAEGKIKICMTGSFETFNPRSEAFKIYPDKIVEADVKKCDYLVTNEVSNSSKYRYATEHGIKIINELELRKLLEEN